MWQNYDIFGIIAGNEIKYEIQCFNGKIVVIEAQENNMIHFPHEFSSDQTYRVDKGSRKAITKL